MIRLYVAVEGQTEQEFVRKVLAPHIESTSVLFAASTVWTRRKRGSAAVPKGGGSFTRWEKHIRNLLGSAKASNASEVRVTTLFDLYGLPNDFPGLASAGSGGDPSTRCRALEQSLADCVGDGRLIPYVQKHEFEALVFAALVELESQFEEKDRAGIQRLAKEVAGLDPEDIDDGPESAPSKRLKRHVPGYSKTIHGTQALFDAGLSRIRARCPRFDAWVGMLEEVVSEGS